MEIRATIVLLIKGTETAMRKSVSRGNRQSGPLSLSRHPLLCQRV